MLADQVHPPRGGRCGTGGDPERRSEQCRRFHAPGFDKGWGQCYPVRASSTTSSFGFRRQLYAAVRLVGTVTVVCCGSGHTGRTGVRRTSAEDLLTGICLPGRRGTV